MKKFLSLCLIAAMSVVLFAQEEEQGPKPSAASQKYALYRREDSTPSYGLAKVKALVKGLKEDQDMNRRVADQVWNSLSVQVKFTLTMLHGEDFSQNCDMMPQIQDEQKKVFAYFPSAFDDSAAWSERQRKFLKDNRGAVIKLIDATIKKNNRVGNNLKNAILEINGAELIPTLTKVYLKDKKDHDILTVMMLLMNEAKFKGFLNTSIYKSLYGKEDNYRSFVLATPANVELIVGVSSAYYKNRNRKL